MNNITVLKSLFAEGNEKELEKARQQFDVKQVFDPKGELVAIDVDGKRHMLHGVEPMNVIEGSATGLAVSSDILRAMSGAGSGKSVEALKALLADPKALAKERESHSVLEVRNPKGELIGVDYDNVRYNF